MKVWNTAGKIIDWLQRHSPTHENGGVDEINVGGLSGDLADLQDPKDHTHQSSGSGVGGQLDHGLAITSASLLDDDHPGYRKKHGIQTIGALTFADATHILTVATGITYWFNGVQKVISGSTTCDIDTYETLTDNTVYWFYFDDASGTLKCSDDLPDFKANAYVATVFWNGTNGAIGREHHGYFRNTNWHVWAHYTIGLRYESGLTLTTPTTDADNELRIENGIIWDEDLEAVISPQETCRIVYKASASIYTWVASALPYAGSGVQPQYLDTDNYTLTNVGASDFACMWVYATNDIDRPIYIIPTHAATAHNIIAQARAEVQPILAALNLSPEVKLIYRFIYKGNGAFQESNDYRLTQALPSGGVATVNAGSVAFIPSGDIAATTVQTAIEELDTEKVAHALATAANDFLVASGSGAYVKQTLAQTLTTLGKAAASGLASLNASTKVVEQPASITDHLDDTEHGTDAETSKAPTSNRLYDHDVATTGVHGVGGGAIVGTALTQTLTNKTLTSPAINAVELGAGTLEILTTGVGGGLRIKSTNAGATGAGLFMWHIKASPAVDDKMRITLVARDGASTLIDFGFIQHIITNIGNGTEASSWSFNAHAAGAIAEAAVLTGAGKLTLTAGLAVGGDIACGANNITLDANQTVDGIDISAGLVALTTKGDVMSYSTVPARLGVGANDTVLTADSGEATGLKWAAAGAWVIAEEEIDSSTCGTTNATYWDWDLSSVTGGGYFLGLFLIQKNTSVDTVKIRTNGAPVFKATTYGSIYGDQSHIDQITGTTSANWIFSDANSIVEVFFDDVSDGDKVMLVAYLPFTPPQAWA